MKNLLTLIVTDSYSYYWRICILNIKNDHLFIWQRGLR